MTTWPDGSAKTPEAVAAEVTGHTYGCNCLTCDRAKVLPRSSVLPTLDKDASSICTVHSEHSLNFLGQRVGRATHASPWHPCSVGDAIHEGMADA